MQKVYMVLFDNDNGYIYVIILIIAKSISDLSKTKITTGGQYVSQKCTNNFKQQMFFSNFSGIGLVFSLAACKDTGVQVNNPAPTAQATDNGEANNGGNTDGEAPETSEPSEESPVPNNSGEDAKPVKKDIKVKALYLTGWTVGSDERLQHYVDLANRTEINAYVVDIKDDDGYVGYESNIPAVREIGAWKSKYNVDKVLKTFHDNNIHVIGRLVCFKDPVLSSKKPELAVKSVNGGSWRDIIILHGWTPITRIHGLI